jgi:hypothetical protein
MTSKPGTDGGATGRPARTRRRPRSLAVLLAVCFAVWLSAVPGVAAAAPPTSVKPLLDCYRTNTDGSITVVLGYTNPSTNTTAIPYGSRNIMHPSKLQGSQPTQFLAGTHKGVLSLEVTQADLDANARWVLDGNTLDYRAAAGSATECAPSTPLPALGNGAGIAAVLLAGGAFGVWFVRRVIRRSAASA